MAADFMAVVAANYVRNLKQEIRKGQLAQLKAGLLPWAAPIGYLNNGAAQLKTHDPATEHLVKKAFELYASGTHSLRTLVVAMDRLGLRTAAGRALSKGGIEKMLSNPFYCGVIRIRKTGQTYQGAHKPIIASSLFQRVQEIKAGKTVKKVTRHNHLYRGLFRCKHCTRSLVGEWQKGRVYYRCQTPACVTKTIREDEVDLAILRLLHGLELSKSDLCLVRERLPQLIAPNAVELEVKAIRLKADNVERRLDRLTDLLLDEHVDAETFQTKKQELLLKRQRFIEELAAVEKNALSPATVQNFLELATSLAALYRSAGKPQKRRIVEWATSNRVASGRSVCFEPSKWLVDTQQTLGVLCCADARPSSRTNRSKLADLIRMTEKITSHDLRPD